ncbi:hypothetical protein HZH66_009016 [Vespula vulgaris]|uniref:Uncharacterized protein n=2 Tax=Vespula TaxID=7451 RepID=A0A834NWM5_VESPE|nr:hypothetical protein HZH66_009016 [Vespula vulgaris]KAF7419926.1 hypothetical protein H0235_010223 [Vespula pensylvanica]
MDTRERNNEKGRFELSRSRCFQLAYPWNATRRPDPLTAGQKLLLRIFGPSPPPPPPPPPTPPPASPFSSLSISFYLSLFPCFPSLPPLLRDSVFSGRPEKPSNSDGGAG